MEYSRRRFLALLGTAAPAFALDPERALWVPGAKTISIPAVRPFLAVGDIVTFGGLVDRYIVTAAASSEAEVSRARFRHIGAPLRDLSCLFDFRWSRDECLITRVERLGPPISDTVFPKFAAFRKFREERAWQALTPELLRRL